MILFKHFNFDSAHFLPNVPDGHKCRTLHGHTYRLTLYFEGELDRDLRWVIDFSDIKSVVNPIIALVDHKLLNDIEGLETPTCEHVAMWLWDKIKVNIPQLCKIKLYETHTSGVVYEGA